MSLEKGKEFREITPGERIPASGPCCSSGRWTSPSSCPTEIAEFGRRNADFRDRDTQLLGASTDTHYVHLAWRQQPSGSEAPALPHAGGHEAHALERASACCMQRPACRCAPTFIVDPQGIIRHVNVNDLSVGRNVDEVLRVLDALQTDELCPCNWQRGEPTLEAA